MPKVTCNKKQTGKIKPLCGDIFYTEDGEYYMVVTFDPNLNRHDTMATGMYVVSLDTGVVAFWNNGDMLDLSEVTMIDKITIESD